MEQNKVLQDTVQEQSELIQTQKTERAAILEALVVAPRKREHVPLFQTCSQNDITRSLKSEKYDEVLRMDIDLQTQERIKLIDTIQQLKEVLENYKDEIKIITICMDVVKKEYETISEAIESSTKERDTLNKGNVSNREISIISPIYFNT